VRSGGLKISFPGYTPIEAGEISWTAILEDGDPDEDQVVSATMVNGEVQGQAGIEIRKFQVTGHVRLASATPVEIRLDLRISGVLADTPFTVTGIQNEIEVYRETLVISGDGDSGKHKLTFPGYLAVEAGEIAWTISMDGSLLAEATTLVEP
jgi:hypothetical protein